MAVWSVINFSIAREHDRFSAEYWRPEYLEPLTKRVPWTALGAVLKRVQYGISREMNEDGYGVPCFRMNEMEAVFLATPKKHMLVDDTEQRQYRLKRGDVLFNRTNSLRFVGRTGYYGQDAEAVFASYLMRLVPDTTKLLPEYLAVYLNTGIGIGQVKRRAMESINQANVSGSEVKLVPIPLFPIAWQEEVAEYVHHASQMRQESQSTCAKAEALLKSSLGLDKLDLTPRLFYERPYARVQAAGRFDAEYFQPWMQDLVSALSRDGLTISDVAKLSKRRFRPNAGTDFHYIEIGDVSGNGTANSNPVAGEEAPSRATWIVRASDVITTTVAAERRLSAVISEEQDEHVCTSGFAVLSPQRIEPEVLMVYLRLPQVSRLVDAHKTGTILPAVATTDLMRIPISLPDKPTRKRIAAKVQESFRARQEARRLLDEAKALVERAILSANGGGR